MPTCIPTWLGNHLLIHKKQHLVKKQSGTCNKYIQRYTYVGLVQRSTNWPILIWQDKQHSTNRMVPSQWDSNAVRTPTKHDTWHDSPTDSTFWDITDCRWLETVFWRLAGGTSVCAGQGKGNGSIRKCIGPVLHWNQTVYTPVRDGLKAYIVYVHCQSSATLCKRAKQSSLQLVKAVHE